VVVTFYIYSAPVLASKHREKGDNDMFCVYRLTLVI